MSRSDRRAHLARVLDSHVQTIYGTLQMLEKPAASSLDKVEWSEVTKFGDEVSKQATVAGMLWSGEKPEVKALEENLAAYFNILNGFILLCHGSTVGAGTTLHASIQTSAKQVIDCSISLLKEAVPSYDSRNSNKRLSIPQLAGSVWEACNALKKVPTTNYTAIGRAMTQVAVSVKDVLREMGELNSAASGDSLDVTSKDSCASNEEDDMNGDLGDDLSPEEMQIAESAVGVISDTLAVIKELIRFITSLLKSSSRDKNTEEHASSLERLLSNCKEMGSEMSDLGACLYPPQEISQMKLIVDKMHSLINQMCQMVKTLNGSPDSLFGSVKMLENSLEKLQGKLKSGDVVTEMQKLSVAA